MNAQERPPSRFRSRRHFGHALCVGFTAFSAFSAVAAERTWDGGGRSSHWSDDSNWTGLSGAPVAGDYTGTTVAGEGTLTLEGVQTNSTVHLDGGLLRGRGWVGTITSDAGGTVAPGLGQPGNHVALHARDVTFNPATTLHIQINSDDPGFENSLLDVGGIVDLDGCALKLEPLFVPAVGESFLILANDRTEPIVGAFGGLPEGAVFEQSNLRWRVSYIAGSGNDVSVTLIEHLPPAFTSFRITRPFAQYITVQFTASAMPRTRYFLETSTNLSTWTTSQFMLMSNPEGLLTYGTTAPDSFPRRFHRLKLVP